MTRRERVRQGRVRGYRPSVPQFEELLQVAQNEMDHSTSSAEITSTIGEYKLTTDEGLNVIAPADLQGLIKDAGDMRELDNLIFVIEQDEPKRYIQIKIGLGDWTEYTVESDSDTWMLGRYYELTDKLLSDCTLYAKSKEPSPAMLVKQRDRYVWESVPWKAVEGWRASVAGASSTVPFAINTIAPIFAAVLILFYVGSSNAEKHKYIQDINHYVASGGLAASMGILVSYVLIYVALLRWNTTRLKSRLKISPSPIMARLTFRGTYTDQIALLSLYVAIAILIATVTSQI